MLKILSTRCYRQPFIGLLFSLAVQAYSQELIRDGSIRLTDTNGATIVTANVTVQPTGSSQIYRLSVNATQAYLAPPLPPGRYVIRASVRGFDALEQTIRIEPHTIFPITFSLRVAENRTSIDVVDTDTRDRLYSVERNTSASRVNLSLLDLPQDVTTIPRAVLQDQKAITLADAVRNVAGTATDFGFNGSSEPLIILRGFQATSMTAGGSMSGIAAYYVDGTKIQGIPIDMAQVQTVEVIKGPETVLYGRAEPGGIVNVVQRPFEQQPSFALEETGSSYSASRSIAEAAGPLDKSGRWLGKASGSWTQNRSNRDFVRDRLGSGLGGMRWSPRSTDQYSITLGYTDQAYRNDYGIPADLATRRPYDLPWSRQFNDSPELSFARPATGTITGRHSFSDAWSVNGKALWMVAKLHDADVTPYRMDLTTGADCLATTGELCMYYYYARPDGQYRLHQENIELQGDMHHQSVRHRLLIGGDFYDSVKKGALYFSQLDPVNIFNPVQKPQPKLDKRTAAILDNLDTNRWKSGYFQDTMSIGSRLNIVGAVRLDGTSAVYATSTTQPNRAFFASPRLGFVWRLLPNVSVYGQFQDAVDANNGRDAATNAPLAAEKSRQFETGLKYQAASGKWNATLATYQLTKRNRADYSLYPTIITIGEARSRGVELDVLGRLNSRLAAIMSYGYTEAVVTKDLDYKGTFLADVPRHGGSIWARYMVSKNVSGGLGVFAQSFRQGDQPNTFILPGYGRMDAMFSYSFVVSGIRATMQANGDNLLDKHYFSGSHQFVQDWIQPGASRTVTLSVRFNK